MWANFQADVIRDCKPRQGIPIGTDEQSALFRLDNQTTFNKLGARFVDGGLGTPATPGKPGVSKVKPPIVRPTVLAHEFVQQRFGRDTRPRVGGRV